ncbi:MAG: hypothetical protein ACFCUJ_15425 [Thiotrichales bacterium]
MIRLNASLRAWGSPEFPEALRSELEQLDPTALPLQRGVSRGSYVADTPVRVMVISTHATETEIQASVGLFFASVIAGCSCADDPTPIDTLSEYCEVRVAIDRTSAEARMTLVPD